MPLGHGLRFKTLPSRAEPRDARETECQKNRQQRIEVSHLHQILNEQLQKISKQNISNQSGESDGSNIDNVSEHLGAHLKLRDHDDLEGEPSR